MAGESITEEADIRLEVVVAGKASCLAVAEAVGDLPAVAAVLGAIQAVAPVPACPVPAPAPVPVAEELDAPRRSGTRVPLAGLLQDNFTFP